MLFSDVFKISKKNIEDYGAIDLSLASDTTLYIDPLLIYSNDDENIRKQYQNILKYLLFLAEVYDKVLEQAENFKRYND